MQRLESVAGNLNVKVCDVMSKEVQTVPPNTSIAAAIDLMGQYDLRRIVVVDQQKRLVGVVSQRDVLKHYFSPEQLTAAQSGDSSTSQGIAALIAKPKPIAVLPNTPLLKAAVVLATNKIGCLPVVGSHRELKGLLTITDLFRHIAGRAKQTLESEFEFFQPGAKSQPKTPAYIRRNNGDVVIPLSWVGDPKKLPKLAVLGFDAMHERILVKFVDEGEKNETGIRFKYNKEHLEIPARDFIAHFNLAEKASVFDVTWHKDRSCLVLTRKQTEAGLPELVTIGSGAPGEG